MSTRTGIYLALTTAVISGFSIYLNKFAVKAMSDALLFTTLKNSLVGLALIGYLIAAMRRWRVIGLSGRQRLELIGLALIGGSLPFLLFFEGLSQASAPSAALIHKSLFVWVALLAVPMLGERPGGWSFDWRSGFAGLALLAVGQLLTGWPQVWGWGRGENLILLATLLWAGETILARRLLPGLSTALVASARMAGGAIVMWLYLLATGQAGGIHTLSAAQWSWVVVTSVLLLGYVTTWYAALRRAPATIVTSVLTIGAVITAGLSLAEGSALAAGQLVGLLIMVAGAALLIGVPRIDRRTDARLTA